MEQDRFGDCNLDFIRRNFAGTLFTLDGAAAGCHALCSGIRCRAVSSMEHRVCRSSRMNFFCFGLNHRSAPIEARERFAGHARSPALLRDRGCSEVLLLTTCNRVEIYAAANANIANEEIAQSLRIDDGPSSKNDLEAFYRKENAECARHLFRVAAGLDSMVVGETEILGQAKRAYADARANGNAGPLLHRLCQRAFRAAKQVRSKTQITRGPVSVGSVAVELAEKIFGDLRGRKVLVLGLGKRAPKLCVRSLLAAFQIYA